MHQKSMPSSSTPPADSIGAVLSVDAQQLADATHGGCTHQLISVDEKSGLVALTLCKSKSAADIFFGFQELVHKVYNAHGHRVASIHTDSEYVFKAVQGPLGTMGITMTQSPPEQHVQRG
jgi:hypothetical protein